MAVRLNENKEIVAEIREGLKKQGDIARAVWKGQMTPGACAGNLKNR